MGLFWCWANQGGFSEGLLECTLQDTELYLYFSWLSVKWNGSVNLKGCAYFGTIYTKNLSSISVGVLEYLFEIPVI